MAAAHHKDVETIQSKLAADASDGADGIPCGAKIGIGAGERVLDGDALFGSTINLTSRICDHAEPDQILAAQVVRDLCMGKGLSFTSLGSISLKGFD